MAENLRVTMRRNVAILKEFTAQAEAAEGLLDRVAERAGAIGDNLAAGLRRAQDVTAAGVPVLTTGIDGGGGGAGPRSTPVLFDGYGRPVLGLGREVSGGGGGGGGGNRGGMQRVGASPSGGEGSAGGPAPLSGGPGGGSGGGGGSFERVAEAGRATVQAVRSLDGRSVPLLSSIDAGIRRLGDRLDRLSDLGVISRAD